MSAFGNDCHFYYSSTCVKGDTCSFRHCEAARENDKMCMFWKQNKCTKPNCHFRHADLQPTQRNRGEIPCYWENQPVGCAKVNCPFKHFKTRPVNTTDIDSAESPQSELVQQSASQEQTQMIVHPVVVNMADDSDVEMMSPSKKSPLKQVPKMTEARLNAIPNTSTQFQQKQDVDDSQFESQAVHQRREESSQPHERDLRQMIPAKMTSQKATVFENPSQIKNVVATQQQRISVKQRLNSGRIPAQKVAHEREAVNMTKNTVVDQTLTQNNQSRVSVKERLQMGGHKVNSLETKKLPVHQRLALAKKATEKQSDSDTEEDSDVEVKSLEQIQREKALRSMGLIELKNGKVVKISEKENMKQSSDEKVSSDDEEFEKDDEEVEKDDEEFENGDQSAAEAEDDDDDDAEEVEEGEVGEEMEDPEIELEEPEIEIYEAREEIQDTRKAVQKDKISLSEKVILNQKKSLKLKGSDSGTQGKKKRRVIIDDEVDNNKTPDLKPSLIKRLGKRVEPDNKLPIRVGNTNDGEIRRTLKEPVGSTNQGTIKVVTGIKSRLGLNTADTNTEKQGVKKRLGWRKKPVQVTSNDEDSLESSSSVLSVKKRGWRKKETDGEVDSQGTESDGSGSNQGTCSRKRTWRKTLKVDDSEKEIDDDIPVTESRPYAVKDEEKKKRKEDPGAIVQNAITQRWKNLGVWSSRNSENKKAVSKRPELQFDKLGLGIIDIQGGKVVKIGKTENKTQDSQGASKQGEEWVMASKQKLLVAKKDNKKERQIYVPPGRKREADSGISDRSLQAVSPLKRMVRTENSNDGFDNGSKEEPEVKTFAQIMAAKSQRQKRKLEKEKLAEKAKNKKITPVSLGHSDDSSGSNLQLPDNIRQNIDTASSSPSVTLSSEASDKQVAQKKLSKWKRKSKNNTSSIDAVVTRPTENLSSKVSAQVDISEPAENVRQNDVHILSQEDNIQSYPVSNELVQSEKSVPYGKMENHMLKTSTESSAENKGILLEEQAPGQNDMCDTESTDDFSMPAKRVDHSLSDSWLDFDTTDICGETPVQDDDDLLKEIDELLA